MTRGLKSVMGVILLLISVLGIALYGAGSHGNFMFRPHMTEDWIIWGIVIVSGIAGTIMLKKQFFKIK